MEGAGKKGSEREDGGKLRGGRVRARTGVTEGFKGEEGE